MIIPPKSRKGSGTTIGEAALFLTSSSSSPHMTWHPQEVDSVCVLSPKVIPKLSSITWNLSALVAAWLSDHHLYNLCITDVWHSPLVAPAHYQAGCGGLGFSLSWRANWRSNQPMSSSTTSFIDRCIYTTSQGFISSLCSSPLASGLFGVRTSEQNKRVDSHSPR